MEAVGLLRKLPKTHPVWRELAGLYERHLTLAGGPARLLRGFPEDCPPTLIVQHVNARFAPAIAKTLDNISNLTSALILLLIMFIGASAGSTGGEE